VSNTSLVMGFAGSGAASTAIAFAGLAGLLAGAFSMAAGEYISMRSQREAYERESRWKQWNCATTPKPRPRNWR